jgi:hypothetical protein
MVGATGRIIARTATTIKATDAIMTNNDMTVAIEMINITITLVAKRMTTRKIPMRRKDDHKHDHFKMKSDEAMNNDQSSSLSMDTLFRKKS